MNIRRVLFLAVLAPAAAAASAMALASLAAATGWPGLSGWLVPISLDGLAAFAIVEWASSKTSAPARAYARTLAVSALAASVVGNAVAHLVSSGLLVPGPVLVVLVGSVPPAALGTAVHLAVLASSPVPSRRPSRRPAASVPARPTVPDGAVRGPLHAVRPNPGWTVPRQFQPGTGTGWIWWRGRGSWTLSTAPSTAGPSRGTGCARSSAARTSAPGGC